jgi:hypothetical protein
VEYKHKNAWKIGNSLADESFIFCINTTNTFFKNLYIIFVFFEMLEKEDFAPVAMLLDDQVSVSLYSMAIGLAKMRHVRIWNTEALDM